MPKLRVLDTATRRRTLFSCTFLFALLILFPGPIQGTNTKIHPELVEIAATDRRAETESNKAVVFDIDGTLTYYTLMGGFRRSSQDAVKLWMDMGYHVVLVTARPLSWQWFTSVTLNLWGYPFDRLTAMVFAPGLFDTIEERAAYKKEAIASIATNLGLDIQYAYGDSRSDFDAYEAAGIDASHVFALRRKFHDTCKEGNYAECLESYEDHINDFIALQPMAL